MRMQVDMLGTFRITVDGRAIPAGDWRRARSVALVKLLALSPGHRLHREQAMEALWPSLSPEAASANLRKAVHFARRALGRPETIVLDGDIVALAPHAELVIDAEVFDAAAKAALRANEPGACMGAAERFGGDLLPDDRYAEWSEEPRERLRQLYARVCKAGRLWERLLAVDPTNEEAQRMLMQAALDSGNRGEVIRQFQRIRDRLRIDLGLGPAAATVAIYERALAPSPVAPADVADRIRAQLAWGMAHVSNGEFGKAEQIAREARTLALSAGLAREVGEASALLGVVAHMQGKWLDLFRSEFVESVRRTPEFTSNIFDGHLCLAEFCLCGAGGHDAIALLSRELLAVAEHCRSVHGRALATLILGEAELFSGRLDSAEELFAVADKLNTDGGGVAGQCIALQRLAEIALARGQKWRAGRILRKGLRLAESAWLAPHLMIRLQALAVEAASSTADAMNAVKEGDRRLATGNVCQPCSMGFRVASAIAMAEAGDGHQASRRLAEAERLAGMWQGGPWIAAIWEARGVQRLAEGHPEPAAALFREAALRYGELGRARDQARCVARATARNQ